MGGDPEETKREEGKEEAQRDLEETKKKEGRGEADGDQEG